MRIMTSLLPSRSTAMNSWEPSRRTRDGYRTSVVTRRRECRSSEFAVQTLTFSYFREAWRTVFLVQRRVIWFLSTLVHL
jgi:hypothetical protein